MNLLMVVTVTEKNNMPSHSSQVNAAVKKYCSKIATASQAACVNMRNQQTITIIAAFILVNLLYCQ